MLQAARDLAEVAPASPAPAAQARKITLLELVAAVSEHASSDEEVVATVAHLINSGQVLLIGNFVGKDVRVG